MSSYPTCCCLCFIMLMCSVFDFFFFKQKTAYEMRISDWSSDLCSSDLLARLSDILDMAASLHKRLMHDLDIEQACDSHPWLRRHALQVCSEVLAQCLLDTPDPTQALAASQKLLGHILMAAIKSLTASLGISGQKAPSDIEADVSARPSGQRS